VPSGLIDSTFNRPFLDNPYPKSAGLPFLISPLLLWDLAGRLRGVEHLPALTLKLLHQLAMGLPSRVAWKGAPASATSASAWNLMVGPVYRM
jgi:hypothetical protein